MSKSVRKRSERYEDDAYYSKNHGHSVRYRKRLIEDKEARQAREDALKELTEESQKLGLYEDQ